jgi:hypothetical protein
MKYLVVLLAGALISSPLCAVEVKGNIVMLTDEDVMMCEDGGGCGVVTIDALREALQKKYDAGLHDCRNDTGFESLKRPS